MGALKRNKNKKKRTFLDFFKRFIFWLIFLSFWGLAFWTILFSEMMEIKKIEIIGDSRNNQEIKQLIKKKGVQKYLDLVSKNNLLLFPTSQIEDEILDRFKMVREVDVSRSFPDTIEVRIEERELALLWRVNEQYFLVDERAEIFYKATDRDLEGETFLISDGSKRRLKIGDKVINTRIIKLILDLEEVVSQKLKISLDKKTFFIPSPMSQELQVKTKAGWKIYFSTERELALQVKILKKMLANEIDNNDLTKLEYIDMRVKGKVVYRFKDYKEREKELEEMESAESTKVKGSSVIKKEKNKEKKKKREEG